MGNGVALDARKSAGMSLWKSLILAVPMLLLTLLMVMQGHLPSTVPQAVAGALTLGFLNLLFFMMLFTGRTDKYRSVLFVTIAICFVISFTTSLIQVRGSLALTRQDMVNGDTPFCHLVIPMTVIPAALTKTIIFPGHLFGGFAPIAGMMIIWLGASLALGRGWCSWACFFGGMDEGCSRIRKKPVIKHIDRKWTYMPHAVLLGCALTSAVALYPTYCFWLCPFKAVTEFEKVDSLRTLVAAFIFVSLFIGLVIVLPVLTRRRIQCGLFCPFASFQSFTNKLNVFDIRIDREKCSDCSHCVNTCPTFSLDEASVKRGATLLSCTKCGHCVDACPKNAVSFHIKGTAVNAAKAARILFLYPAFVFASAIGGGDIYGTLLLAINFFRSAI